MTHNTFHYFVNSTNCLPKKCPDVGRFEKIQFFLIRNMRFGQPNPNKHNNCKSCIDKR